MWRDEVGEDLRYRCGYHTHPDHREVLVSHVYAFLTPRGRLALAKLVVEDGWSVRRAAERFQCSPSTAKTWADRFRVENEAGTAPPVHTPAAPDTDSNRTANHQHPVHQAVGTAPDRLPPPPGEIDGRGGAAALQDGETRAPRPGHRAAHPASACATLRTRQAGRPGPRRHQEVRPDPPTAEGTANSAARQGDVIDRGGDTPTCTTPLTTTPGWPTPRSSATNARRP